MTMQTIKKFRIGSNRSGRRVTGPPVGPVIAPAIISRVPTFQPTFRRGQPRGMDETFTTQFGTVRVAGRLTETHRKVLDAIFATPIEEYDMPTGAKAFLVDPYQLAKVARVAHNPRWLSQIMEDMRVATVHIIDHQTGLEHHAGIVSEYRESHRRVPMPGGAIRGDRPLMVATISSAWMRIYRASLVVRYRNILPIINRAKHGATHALALYVITNRAYNRALTQTLLELGAIREDMSERRRRAVKADVLSEAELLAELGIVIEGGTVYYHQHSAIHFRNPDVALGH